MPRGKPDVMHSISRVISQIQAYSPTICSSFFRQIIPVSHGSRWMCLHEHVPYIELQRQVFLYCCFFLRQDCYSRPSGVLEELIFWDARGPASNLADLWNKATVIEHQSIPAAVSSVGAHCILHDRWNRTLMRVVWKWSGCALMSAAAANLRAAFRQILCHCETVTDIICNQSQQLRFQ